VIDSTNDLFIPFHYFITCAINIVCESYYCSENPALSIASPVLDTWLKFKFMGKESFEVVQQKLFGSMYTVGEYIQFVLLILRMDELLRLLMQQSVTVYIIAFTMSLSSFKKFNKDNFRTPWYDLLSYGSTKHS
jgi:hypothetical protein